MLPSTNEWLRQLAFFGSINDDDLSALASMFQEHAYKHGDVILASGDTVGGFAAVLKGTLAYEDGKETVVVGAGDGFGLGALLLPTRMQQGERLVATSDAHLAVLIRKDFQSAANARPSISSVLRDSFGKSPLFSLVQRNSKADRRSQQSKMAVFGSREYDRVFFEEQLQSYNQIGVQVEFIEARLEASTVSLAKDACIVCVFVDDVVNADVIEKLRDVGIKLIALRCAGSDHVDLEAAKSADMRVVRVPAYGPNSVAEHTIALILALNRHLPQIYNRVRFGNFALSLPLLGFEMKGKTVGVLGTGKIGYRVVQILRSMECKVICYDPAKNPRLDGQPDITCVDHPDALYSVADIVTLHLPLLKSTRHLISQAAIKKMKKGAMLINTSRGGLIDTDALIDGLKSGQIGACGLDVYEAESGQFYHDLSGGSRDGKIGSMTKGIPDDVLARLVTFNNVIVTGHQGYFTREAMAEIARVTCENVREFMSGAKLSNERKCSAFWPNPAAHGTRKNVDRSRAYSLLLRTGDPNTPQFGGCCMSTQAFGQHLIRSSEIFYRSALSVAFVNLKPILPGHVLVISRRVVPRFTDLTAEEVADLFLVSQRVGRVVEQVYSGTALTIALQDGAAAGQSVFHAHVHVIPRKFGDFVNNDDIYGELHTWNKIEDAARKPRTLEEMAAEADMLRPFFSSACEPAQPA